MVWVVAGRLSLFTLFLGLIGFLRLDSETGVGGAETVQTSLATLAVAFAISGVYAVVLRTGKWAAELVYVQVVVDQVVWTIAVYLTGGVASGAASLYGLSCLVGAILGGFGAAVLAAAAASVCYSALVIALHTGRLAPPSDQPLAVYVSTTEDLVYHIVVNVLSVVIVPLLAADLSERLRAESGRVVVAEHRATQAEHMASLGRLAAGLAHEIRNPLGSSAGSSQRWRSSPALGEEDRQLCEIIERESARLSHLATDMMDLSSPRVPQKTAVDAAAIAREVVALASQSGRGVSDVKIEFVGDDEAMVNADGSQLHQLIWNLVRNAVQASTAGDAVKVRVSRTDGEVQLNVEDQGVGLAPEAIERIFDAYYTTRTQGTGVGLAVVQRIADDHGFVIEVQSEQGRGAIFLVHLVTA